MIFRPERGRRLPWEAVVLPLVLAVDLLALSPRLLPPARVVLASARLQPVDGAAHWISMSGVTRLPYWLAGDTPAADRRSRLRLFEDGVPLGPAHTLHATIAREGHGRYSHWQGGLVLSSSDGSDPRSNGRRYEVEAPRSLHPLAWWLVAAVNVPAGWVVVRWVASGRGPAGPGHRLARLVPWIAAALLVVVAGEAPGGGGAGVADVAVAAVAARELAGPALAAALLGILACAAHSAAGAGLVVLGRGRATSVTEAILLGYPAGLAVSALAAAAGLALPGGPAAAIAVPLLCAAPLLGWRPAREATADLALTALAALPAALLLGVVMGLLWHPPTATLAAVPMGDLVYYGAKAWMLEAVPWPHRNLGVDGETSGYFNALPSALAAVLIRAGGSEPQWVVAAGAPAFAALALALVLRAAALEGGAGGRPGVPVGPAAAAAAPGRAPRGAGETTSLVRGVVVAGLVASAARYASWLVESPPVMHALPLIVSVTWLTWRAARRAWPLLGAGATAVAGCALAKITALPVLVAMVGASLLAGLRQRPARGAAAAMLLGGAGLAALGAHLLVRYAPVFAVVATLGPESWPIVAAPETIGWRWPWLVRDLGIISLGAAGGLLGLEVGVATLTAAALFLAAPFLFTTSQMLSCLVVASSVLLVPPARRRLALLAVAAAPLLVWMLAFDPGGWWARLTWVGVMGGIGVLATRGPGHARDALVSAAGGLLFTGGVLVAVAGGRLAVDADYAPRQPGVLTPAMREVWTRVRSIVPRDAIVFTDMVAGPGDVSLSGGWNTYAASGQRQLWISNWMQSHVLRSDPSLIAVRLETNRAVLEGRLDPSALALSRPYREAWAVVRADGPVPAGWQRRFANRDWAIWRIGPITAADRSGKPRTRDGPRRLPSRPAGPAPGREAHAGGGVTLRPRSWTRGRRV
jgi:hypothetical protein